MDRGEVADRLGIRENTLVSHLADAREHIQAAQALLEYTEVRV